jgi:FxsC-like protein
VTEQGGWGEDIPRPYFFLSYAHTPVSNALGGGDPNLWVDRLFKDLCRIILEITDLPSGVPPGFMDRGMHLGEGWPDRLSEALAHCRVFVPLYSPRYFRSLNCGQEWQAFTSRPVYQRQSNGGHASGVVPVLWVTMLEESLPQTVRRLQFNHSDFGHHYVTEGLFALMKLGYFRDEYELAVYRLAQRIVQVAAQTMIPVDEVRRDYQGLASAFEDTVPSRPLRISVLAADLATRPPGRSEECYGEDPLDWQPYRPGPGRSLAEHAARVARQLDFHPSIHRFEDEAKDLLRGVEPTAPGLLLLDRWALHDAERRRLAHEFDQLNPAWVSLIEPWCQNDPERERGEGEFGPVVAEIFRSKRREAKPSLRAGLEGLPTIESFSAELPKAAQRAMHGFEDRRKPQAAPRTASSGRSTGRPSLRDPVPGSDDPSWQQHHGLGGGTP